MLRLKVGELLPLLFSGLKLFKMIMETDALRKILRRFKVSDFNEILKRWPYLRNRKLENISSLKRKIELVNRVLEIAKVSIIKPIHYFPIMVTCVRQTCNRLWCTDNTDSDSELISISFVVFLWAIIGRFRTRT